MISIKHVQRTIIHSHGLINSSAIWHEFKSRCAFGVRAGKFLVYMVTERGIELNPNQVKAIQDMKSPRNIKEVQALTFFKVLRKASRFEWGEECELAFHQLKEVLAKLPLLMKPIPGEILYIYLSVGERAVGSVLVREERSRQVPLYYASKLLRGAEVGYPKIEKVGVLVSAARKLQPYFLSHPIVVQTNFPLNTTLGRVDASGRMMKWAMELGSSKSATNQE